MLSYIHIITIFLTLILVTGVGVYSVRKVKNASDFSVGSKSIGAPLVAGIILGTILGGSSTVATSQMAFKYGLSAMWFTLGSGIACLILGLFLVKPLRSSEANTVPEFLAKVYGEKAGLFASIFSSLGIFLNIIGQILSSIPLLTSMFDVTLMQGAVISVLLVIAYVIFGGVWGTGMVGNVKTLLIYFSMIIAGGLAYNLGGGMGGYLATFEPYPWFSLLGRGVNVDLAAGFSVIVGILSTQTYLQAVFSGKSVKAARSGVLISALLIPPIGLASVIVGLYMRANFPTINAHDALPIFVIEFLPDWLGGIILATLLISSIGTGAGLVLGVSTMLSQDIYKRHINPLVDDKKLLIFSRLSIVVITTLTLLFVSGNMNSLILQWSFLSMGLRGATICFPLLAAIIFPKYITPRAGTGAIVLAPLVTLIWFLLDIKFMEPLYIGLLVSLIILIFGSLVTDNNINK